MKWCYAAFAAVLCTILSLAPTAQTPPAAKPSVVSEQCKNACRHDGRCQLVDRRCVVGSDADCEQSDQCRQVGACTRQGGHCVAGKGDCAASAECSYRGACTRVGGRCQLSCTAPNDLARAQKADPVASCSREPATPCRDTIACKEYGVCGEASEGCILSDEGCASLPSCGETGKCSRTEDPSGWGRCGARNDSDCAQSKGCKEGGRCSAYNDECVGPKQIEHLCGGPGWIVHEGQCVRPLGYDCKAECETSHKCDAHEFDGAYVMCIETARYCRTQPRCKQSGLCKVNVKTWYSYNKCAYSDESRCGEWWYGSCVKSESDCKKSVDCKRSGNCSAASPSQYCRPTRKEHCEQSEICKNEGQCKLLDESSYFICGD